MPQILHVMGLWNLSKISADFKNATRTVFVRSEPNFMINKAGIGGN